MKFPCPKNWQNSEKNHICITKKVLSGLDITCYHHKYDVISETEYRLYYHEITFQRYLFAKNLKGIPFLLRQTPWLLQIPFRTFPHRISLSQSSTFSLGNSIVAQYYHRIQSLRWSLIQTNYFLAWLALFYPTLSLSSYLMDKCVYSNLPFLLCSCSKRTATNSIRYPHLRLGILEWAANPNRTSCRRHQWSQARYSTNRVL